MSQLNVDTIRNRLGTAGPTTPSLTVTNNATVGSAVSINSTGINVIGVVTATSLSMGGQQVSTLGVGIRTTGSISGYGATMIDFRGSGISTVTVGSGIATVNIQDVSGLSYSTLFGLS
jgi:hypothetical protein